MALVNNSQVLANDNWTIIHTTDVAEDTLMPTINLGELLQSSENEKLNLILPISAVLNTDSLAVELLKLIQSKTNKLAVWVDSEHDYKNAYQASSQQLDDLLNATSKKAQKANPLLAQIVEQLQLIVINVPLFANGRAFSLAEHLRLQGFTGDIRLTGHFGRDQLAYYQRSGVSSYVVTDEELKIDGFFDAFNALKSASAGKSVSSLPMFING